MNLWTVLMQIKYSLKVTSLLAVILFVNISGLPPVAIFEGLIRATAQPSPLGLSVSCMIFLKFAFVEQFYSCLKD